DPLSTYRRTSGISPGRALLLPKGKHGVDFGGSDGRYHAGSNGDRRQSSSREGERQRVVGRKPEEEILSSASGNQREDGSRRQSDRQQECDLADDHQHNFGRGG